MLARADVAAAKDSVQEVRFDLTMFSTALRGLTLLLERCGDDEGDDRPIPFVLTHVAALVGLCAREAERLDDCVSRVLIEGSTDDGKRAKARTEGTR